MVGAERALHRRARARHQEERLLPLVADALQPPRRRHPRPDLPVPHLDRGRPRLQQRDRAHPADAHRRSQVPAQPGLRVRELAERRPDLQGRPIPGQPGRPGELVQQLHPVHRRGGLEELPDPRRPAGHRPQPGPLRRGRRQRPALLLRPRQQQAHRVRLGRPDRQRRRRDLLPLEARHHGPGRVRLPVQRRARRRAGLRGERQRGQGDGDAHAREPDQGRHRQRPVEPEPAVVRAPAQVDERVGALERDQQLLPVRRGCRPQHRRLPAGAALIRRPGALPGLPVLHGQPGRQAGGGRRRKPGLQQLLHHQLHRPVPALLLGAAQLPQLLDERDRLQEAPLLERLGAVRRRQHPVAGRQRVLGRLERQLDQLPFLDPPQHPGQQQLDRDRGRRGAAAAQ